MRDTRDAATFSTGQFVSLEHARCYRHAHHVAWQKYHRTARRLRRSIAANRAAIAAGHGLLLDLPGGILEAQIELRSAAGRCHRYITTYGSPPE